MQKSLQVLSILAIIGLLGTNFAYADYTEWIGLRIPYSKPNVCIFEAENKKVDFTKRHLYDKTKKWIQEAWIDKLNKYTDSNNWDVTYEFISNATHFNKKITDFYQCHVMIVFDAENLLTSKDLTDAQGFTSFDHSNSRHKWAFIDIFTWTPTNEIDLGVIDIGKLKQNEDGSYEIPLGDVLIYEPLTDEAIRIVVQHEFGHAIGLGHYTETLTYEYDSLMTPSVDFKLKDKSLKKFHSTEDDIKAVIQLYGKGGFEKMTQAPIPKFAYGWLESTNRGINELGYYEVHFPDIIWLDPNFGHYR